MSASNEWIDYHLTTEGWLSGTEKLDNGITEVNPPSNRILTRRYKEYVASTYSPLERSYQDIQQINDSDKISKYLKLYPYPSDYYKKW